MLALCSAHAFHSISGEASLFMRSRLFCVMALLLACAGCKTADRGRGDVSVFRFALASDPETFDPARVTGVIEGRIVQQLYEGLVTVAPAGDGVAPGVAERWERLDDDVTYHFTLREDARWSNGEALTAHDFVYAWERILSGDVVAEYAPFLYYMRGAAAVHAGEHADPGDGSTVRARQGFRALSDRVLEVVLNEPTPYFLQMLTYPVFFPVHRESVESAGQREAFRPGALVSNGAYTLAGYRLQSQVTLEKNDSYWDAENVAYESVEAHIIPDRASAVVAYQQGRVDWVSDLPDQQIPFLTAEPGFRSHPGLGTYFFRLNTTREPFDDARVRRAFALALDRSSLCRCTINGAQPATSMVPPMEGYPQQELLSYEPDEARRLLAEAGYPNGDGFPTVTLLYNTSENHRTIAQALQDRWKVELNVEVELENREWRVYLASMDELDFDIARAGWIGDYVDANTFLELFASDNPNNDTGYASPSYDAALDAARRTRDAARRRDFLREAERTLLNDVPVIPLYFYRQQQLVSRSVCGFEDNLRDIHLVRYLSPAAHPSCGPMQGGAR